jgi:hypothetical protein
MKDIIMAIKDIIIRVTKVKLDIVITIIMVDFIILFIGLKDIIKVEVAINIKVVKVVVITETIVMSNFMHMYLHQVNLNLFLEIYKYDIPVFGPGFF